MSILDISPKKAVLVTGGFDPIHSGHIEYLKKASLLGDFLIVGVNSNNWLKRKKDFFFMDWNERALIIKNLCMVDSVISFDDSDDSASGAIDQCLKKYSRIIFANGGDRSSKNIPEIDLYKNNHAVDFVFSVGGENKTNSSSKITKDLFNKLSFKEVKKPWGEYKTLISHDGYKVKKISVNPGERLSLQLHNKRSEHWMIVKGTAEVTLNGILANKTVNDYIFIPIGFEHRIMNIGDDQLVFIEVNLGDYIEEDDIIRLEDDYGRTL